MSDIVDDTQQYSEAMLSAALSHHKAMEDRPLTVVELMEGGWWCTDVSKECAIALKSKYLRVSNADDWMPDGIWHGCVMNEYGVIVRGFFEFKGKKQIHRIGNEFYWSDHDNQ